MEASYARIREDAFNVTGGDITQAQRKEQSSNQNWTITVEPDGNGQISITLPATTGCDDTGAICTGGGKKLSGRVELTVNGPEQQSQERQNNSAIGAPAISGTPQVGETLTASTSGIADQDGLTGVSYRYQWMAGGSNINGATKSSYTLKDVQKGKTIQVRVSFRDDADNDETLTSVATATVVGPLTVRLVFPVASHHGASNVFAFDIRFSEEIPLSYKTLKSHAFTVTGGAILRAQRMNKPSNISWRITVRPDSNGDVTVALPVTTDCDAQGAICTGDGRNLSNSLTMTVSGPAP